MALTTQQQMEVLAENLMECADAIHARLMKAIKKQEVDRLQAQSIFQDEVSLRQRANSLYIDAANMLADDLVEPQASLVELTQDAKAVIAQVKDVAQYIDLVADILVFAAAVYAAKPAAVVVAVKELRDDIEKIEGKNVRDK